MRTRILCSAVAGVRDASFGNTGPHELTVLRIAGSEIGLIPNYGLNCRFEKLLISDSLEPRYEHAIHVNMFNKHGQRADPECTVSVVWTIDDQTLVRFAVSRDALHHILHAFVMPVPAGRRKSIHFVIAFSDRAAGVRRTRSC